MSQRLTKKVLLAMTMVAGGPKCRSRQAGRREVDEAVGLGGLGAGETTNEKGRRTKHKVGRGARAQAPAGKNDHGDYKRGGRGVGRRARVQAPALRREPRRSEGGVHTSRPECILVLSSRPLFLIMVTFLIIVPYVATFPLSH